jgi:hypothetical protein
MERALAELESLATRGEAVEDEWQYVTDLHGAWRARLGEVVAARGAEPVEVTTEQAVDAAIAAAQRIDDPHRAIDWLSTFPQLALLAVGEGS